MIYFYLYKPYKILVMNKYQTAKQDAYMLVVKEAKSNADSIKLIPKFAKGIEQLDAINKEIDAIRIQQEKDLTGIAADKRYTLNNLTDYMVDIAGAMHAYAHGSGNNTLIGKVNYKPSVVEKMSQAEIIAAAGIVCEEAGKIPAAELAEVGVSAEELKEFAELNNYFKNIKSAPREAIIDRSGSTEKLRDLFKEAGKLVKDSLDRLATQFKRKDPDFYLKYRAARNIVYSRPQKEKGAETDTNNKLV
jgi:hypothetical protein